MRRRHLTVFCLCVTQRKHKAEEEAMTVDDVVEVGCNGKS